VALVMTATLQLATHDASASEEMRNAAVRFIHYTKYLRDR